MINCSACAPGCTIGRQWRHSSVNKRAGTPAERSKTVSTWPVRKTQHDASLRHFFDTLVLHPAHLGSRCPFTPLLGVQRRPSQRLRPSPVLLGSAIRVQVREAPPERVAGRWALVMAAIGRRCWLWRCLSTADDLQLHIHTLDRALPGAGNTQRHARLAQLEQRLGVFALQWQLQLLWHVGK